MFEDKRLPSLSTHTHTYVRTHARTLAWKLLMTSVCHVLLTIPYIESYVNLSPSFLSLYSCLSSSMQEFSLEYCSLSQLGLTLCKECHPSVDRSVSRLVSGWVSWCVGQWVGGYKWCFLRLWVLSSMSTKHTKIYHWCSNHLSTHTHRHRHRHTITLTNR